MNEYIVYGWDRNPIVTLYGKQAMYKGNWQQKMIRIKTKNTILWRKTERRKNTVIDNKSGEVGVVNKQQ